MQYIKKRWKIVVIAVALIILGINAFWFVNVYSGYLKDKEGMTKDALGDYYYEEGEYSYYDYSPKYLGKSYSINIGKTEVPETKYDVSLIVWPACDEKEKYGVLIDPVSGDEDNYEIYVDTDLKPVTTPDEETMKIFNAQKDEIAKLYQMYQNRFAE